MGKGKSMAEKLTLMLEIFHESASFFTYAELEKIAIKQKGITQQSCRPVLDDLVSQAKVAQEKVGTQTLYYSLPSEQITRRRRELRRLDVETEEARSAIGNLEGRLKRKREGQASEEERAAQMQELQRLKARKAELTEAVDASAATDPEYVRGLQAAAPTSLEGANRWTDNIFVLRSHCQTKFNTEPAEFNQGLEKLGGLKKAAELDYVE